MAPEVRPQELAHSVEVDTGTHERSAASLDRTHIHAGYADSLAGA